MPLRYDPLVARLAPFRRLAQNKPLGVAVAFASVGLSISARFWLSGTLSAFNLITFYPAVIVTAAVGGFWPGILAAGLSVVAASYFFIPPQYSFALPPDQYLVLPLFAANLGLVAVIIGLLHAALERLWRQENNLRFILDSEPVGVIAVDGKGVITMVNEAIEKQLGYGREELIGCNVAELLPERFRNQHQGHLDGYMQRPEARQMGAGRELYARTRGGEEIPVEIGLNPIRRADKAGALATVIDISERKRLERHQAILVQEIQHRAGNLLAVVQALAMRSFTADRSMDEARKGFLSRLSALAKAQSLFEGEGSVSLYDLVAREATAFGEQLKAGGPDVLLANHAAQSFSLIIHELATNAAKHGALSMPGGKVVVEWKIEGDRFSLAWIESDGPLVASPHRRGFGQSILHDIARNMTAECAASYPPEGFQYRLEVRLSAVGRAVANERVA